MDLSVDYCHAIEPFFCCWRAEFMFIRYMNSATVETIETFVGGILMRGSGRCIVCKVS